MQLTRAPGARLRPFISRVWASDATGARKHDANAERVLPTGATHLVLRLGSEPLRVFADAKRSREWVLGSANVGGIRAAAYFKDVERPVPSVGAVLEPGAAALLLDVSPQELADVHAPLDAFWGRAADSLCDELAGIPQLADRLVVFESRLAARLPAARGIHPALAESLANSSWRCVGDTAVASRLSHRRFGQLFREAVGLSPKRWSRVRRFQGAVARAAATAQPWAEIAIDLGYSDQAHLSREFRELAGISPSEYRRLAPRDANHLPLRPLPVSSRRIAPRR